MTGNVTSAAGTAFHLAEWGIAFCGLGLALLVLLLAPDVVLVVALTTLLTGAVMVWIVWQDLRTFTIPDGAVLTVAFLGMAARWCTPIEPGEPAIWTGLAAFCDAALPGGLLLLLREVYYRRVGIDCLGLGDVKLATAGGLLVGGSAFCWALFTASLLALSVVAAGRLLTGVQATGSDRVAFGAFLAPVLWAIFVVQQAQILLAAADGSA